MPPSAAALRHMESERAKKQAAAKKKQATTKSQGPMRAKGLDFVKTKYNGMFASSRLQDATDTFPKFAWHELKLGNVLGKGGFGTVSEVKAIDMDPSVGSTSFRKSSEREEQPPAVAAAPPPLTSAHSAGRLSFFVNKDDVNSPHGNADDDEEVDDMESRQFIQQHCIRQGGDARYAVKVLSPEVVQNTALFLQGVLDLAVEARFLSDMEHPHIIKLRALGRQSPFENANAYQFFLVLDRLYDTLERRLEKWQGEGRKIGGGFGAAAKKKAATQFQAFYQKRIVVAYDLATAMEYLHKIDICYRDLKPENIGFDIRDDVKLFDFGLAKELLPKEKQQDGTYKMTGMTGSPRYMAPEVAMELPYNQTCDSYSFAVLLWQMLSCQVPYENYNMKSLKEKVWSGPHKRPLIPKDKKTLQSFPPQMQNLLQNAWHKDLHARTTIAGVAQALRKECVAARDGDESGLEKNMRRSTFVFRGGNSGNTATSSGGMQSSGAIDLAGIAELEAEYESD